MPELLGGFTLGERGWFEVVGLGLERLSTRCLPIDPDPSVREPDLSTLGEFKGRLLDDGREVTDPLTENS